MNQRRREVSRVPETENRKGAYNHGIWEGPKGTRHGVVGRLGRYAAKVWEEEGI